MQLENGRARYVKLRDCVLSIVLCIALWDTEKHDLSLIP